MNIVIMDTYSELSKYAAELVAKQIKEKPNSVLGLATGSTPLGMYKELVRLYQKGEIDFSNVKTFNLDEYYGIDKDNPNSYYYYMKENFWDKVNIKKENRHIPPGRIKNIDNACKNYDKLIEDAGGIDLQILGVGPNGHIGFNEPSDKLFINTHVVTLTESTIEANSRFFANKDEVPRQAITMGIGQILKARKIILLANGFKKADIINKALNGFITTSIPVSLLQLHRDTTVILDKEASSRIQNSAV